MYNLYIATSTVVLFEVHSTLNTITQRVRILGKVSDRDTGLSVEYMRQCILIHNLTSYIGNRCTSLWSKNTPRTHILLEGNRKHFEIWLLLRKWLINNGHNSPNFPLLCAYYMATPHRNQYVYEIVWVNTAQCIHKRCSKFHVEIYYKLGSYAI